VWDDIEVPGTPDQISAQLQAFVEQPRWLAWPNTVHYFAGSVAQNRFQIYRIVQGRDSFNPMLFGRFIPSPRGTRVRVLYTFHPVVWLFVLFLSAFTGFYPVFQTISNGGPTELGALFFFVFLWVVALYFFYRGTSLSRHLLRQCLGLQEASRGGG
jgi:hypothetical protein